MPNTTPVRTAVITGGHAYDVMAFRQLFRDLSPEIDAYVQHMDDFASSPEEVRDGYDVVLFYMMLTEGPSDEGLAWHQGRPRAALEHLGTGGQGIFLLHHAILAYPEWPAWNEIVGVEERSFGYFHDETVTTQVVAPAHPLTCALEPWTMVDETYTMADAGPGSEVLLTYDHPRSMRTIAWTRAYRAARVFCYEAGHDNQAWADPHFREVMRRGILWTAKRL